MKIAFDVDVLAKQMDINRMVHQVADWGYKYIEQSPHPGLTLFISISCFPGNNKTINNGKRGLLRWSFSPVRFDVNCNPYVIEIE